MDNTQFMGPISTTYERNQADIFATTTGTIWDIKQQTNKPLSLLFGIYLNKFGISKFICEEEVLLFNTKLPIINTEIKNINDSNDDKNKIILLFNSLETLTHPITKPKKFYRKIGVGVE